MGEKHSGACRHCDRQAHALGGAHSGWDSSGRSISIDGPHAEHSLPHPMASQSMQNYGPDMKQQVGGNQPFTHDVKRFECFQNSVAGKRLQKKRPAPVSPIKENSCKPNA